MKAKGLTFEPKIYNVCVCMCVCVKRIFIFFAYESVY